MKGYTYLSLTRNSGDQTEFHLILDFEPKEEHSSGNVELVRWYPDIPDLSLKPEATDLFLEQNDDETLDECIRRKFEQLIVPQLTIPEYHPA